MPSLIKKPWFLAVCIPVTILGVCTLVTYLMYGKSTVATGAGHAKPADTGHGAGTAATGAGHAKPADTGHGAEGHVNAKKHVHWSHDKNGPDGPDHWGAYSPGEIAMKGIRQSPINILSKSAITSPGLGAIGFHYDDTEFKMKNNGHTIQIDCPEMNNTISVDGHKYGLLQFHFHARSEHLIDGKHYPMELHFVHILKGGTDAYRKAEALVKAGEIEQAMEEAKEIEDVSLKVSVLSAIASTLAKEGNKEQSVAILKKAMEAASDKTAAKLAVVGVMIEEGPPNELIDKLWAKLPAQNHSASFAGPGLNFEDLLPEVGKRSFFRYYGSLTTPPCTENVLWSVMEKPIHLSKEQIERFTKLYNDNYRPPQKVNQRFILRFTDGQPSAIPAALPGASLQSGGIQ